MELIILIGTIVAIGFNAVLIKFSAWISKNRTTILLTAGGITLINWLFILLGPFEMILVFQYPRRVKFHGDRVLLSLHSGGLHPDPPPQSDLSTLRLCVHGEYHSLG